MTDKELYKHIGQLIKQQRIQQNITKKDLAHRSGVSIYLIRNYENGQPIIKMDKLNKIANALGVHHMYFFNGY